MILIIKSWFEEDISIAWWILQYIARWCMQWQRRIWPIYRAYLLCLSENV